ncbi:hypothetical protein N9917_01305 [Deltaproteobacteria bacterium]|nr:hypothetical protein [Deltaproteobacteria bacterium]
MKRIDRIVYRSSAITPDTAEVLRLLEQRAAKYGNVLIEYKGPDRYATWDTMKGPNPTQTPAHLSLRPAGREVSLRARIKDWEGSEEGRRQAEVNLTWELAVPLGFVPWDRYPLPSDSDTVFNYFGIWRRLHDQLCGEGRGELAWPSVVAAAQTDAGTWEGDRSTERFVQGQLHRLGAPCGPVDGIIGERTQLAIRFLGLHGMSLDELAKHLRGTPTPQSDNPGERQFGYIVLPGWKVLANSYGEVHTTHIPQGVALTVDGPGRIVIDVDRIEGAT